MGGSVSKSKSANNGSGRTPVAVGQTSTSTKVNSSDDSCELGNKRSRSIHCYVKLGIMRQVFAQLEAEWTLLAECKNGIIEITPVEEIYTLNMSIVLSPPSTSVVLGSSESTTTTTTTAADVMPSTLILHSAHNLGNLDKLDKLDKLAIIPQVLYGYPVSRNFHVIAERRGLVDRSSVLHFTTYGNPNVELDAVLASLDDASGKLIHILGNPTSNSFIPDEYVIGITKQQAKALGISN